MKKVEYQIVKENLLFQKAKFYPQVKFNDQILVDKISRAQDKKLLVGVWYIVDGKISEKIVINPSVFNLRGSASVGIAGQLLKTLNSYIEFYDNPPASEIIPFEI